ncbi:hypothetical protein HDU98_000227 [Podochytrium sp. JEL0797]|nr:hypothetical protein HDU98_000227 [Podochytrium sp. JEL0797]
METAPGGVPQLVSHVLIAEHGAAQPIPAVKFQYPNAQLGAVYQDAAPLMVPLPGMSLRNEDSFMFVLCPKVMNPNSMPDSETVVPKLRRFNPDVQIALFADAFGFDGRSWKPMSSSRVLIQMAPKNVAVWDEACLRTFAEIKEGDGAEYRQPEKNCVVVFMDGLILGLRFFNENDEITFINHLNTNMKLFEKFTASLQIPPSIPRDPLAPLPLLYCINHVRKFGDKTRAVTLASPYPWVYAFLPLIKAALENFTKNEKIAVITGLFQTINAIDLTIVPRFTTSEKIIMRSVYDPIDMFREYATAMEERGRQRGGKNVGLIGEEWDGKNFEVNTRFLDVAYRVALPLAAFEEEIGEFSLIKLITTFSALDAVVPPQNQELKWRNSAPYFWHPHLDSGSQTHALVFLINAVLSEKRIVFVGNGRTGTDVASFVYAATAIGGGGGLVLSGLAAKTFAVVGMKELQAMQNTTGFIAGTTDPSIEDRVDLFDLLCDINTGKITLSPQTKPASTEGFNNTRAPHEADTEWMRQGYWIGDAEFMLRVVSAIQDDSTEWQVRQIVYEYVERFVGVTAAFELETVNSTLIGRPPVPQYYPGIDPGVFFQDETSKNAEMVMLRNRIEGWKSTSLYFKLQQNHNGNLQKTYLPSTFPLKSMLDQIHKSKPSLSTPLLVQILQYIQDTVLPGPDGGVTEFLACLGNKGVAIFAAGMMHERWEVRRACTRILWRLDWHPIGTGFIQNLNPFYRLCYARTSHLLLTAPDDDPILEPPRVVTTVAPPVQRGQRSPSIGSTAAPKSPGLGLGPPQRRSRAAAAVPSKENARMSILFDERNANRVVFNNTKQGYMRGSVLGSSTGNRASRVGGVGGLGRPGWMQEVGSNTSRKLSLGKPVDMSDLDDMMKNVERLGFGANLKGAGNSPRGVPGSGGAPLSARVGYESSEDEDMDEMERGRVVATGALGRGLSGDLLVNTNRAGAGGYSVAPKSPGGPAMGMMGGQQSGVGSPLVQRSMSAGPPGRAPRGASAGAGSVPLGVVQGASGSNMNGVGQQPVAGVRGPRVLPQQAGQQPQGMQSRGPR